MSFHLPARGLPLADLVDGVRESLTFLGVRGAALVVAVSGGPDSVALLRALALVREDFALRLLIVAHLNHRLRGRESDEDQAFVHDLYRQLAAVDPKAFAWRGHAVDVQQQKAAGDSLESAARTIRYRWLTEVAAECGAAWVATGHTANDQAETVLHRLLRGTGVKGLAGIPPQRMLAPGIDVIRPLLEMRRKDVAAFLQQLQQPFRHDSSNADQRFTRNRIRLKLLPLLEHHCHPGIVEVLCRVAAQARVVNRDVEAQTAELLRQAELPRAGPFLIFDADRLRAAARRMLCEMFRLLWRRENWPQQQMGFAEWQRLADVALGNLTAVDLPGRRRARLRGRVLQIGEIQEHGIGKEKGSG